MADPVGHCLQVVDGEVREYTRQTDADPWRLVKITGRDGKEAARGLRTKTMAEVETARPRQRKGD